jgi:HEAT repeat protein
MNQNPAPANPAAPQPPERPARPGGPRPAPPAVPPEFQAAKILKLDAPELVKILQDPASTLFQKSKACMRLAQVGTKDAVPVLAALLPDEQLSHYARFGLVPIPGPSVDQALRAALAKLKGRLQIGVIDSIAQRRDQAAIDPLAKLIYAPDAEVAKAAAMAIAVIAGPRSAPILQAGLAKTKGPARTVIAEAALVCAERLLESGDRKQALVLFDALTRTDIPKPVRLAALYNTIAAETSRPRVR